VRKPWRFSVGEMPRSDDDLMDIAPPNFSMLGSCSPTNGLSIP
jgi:hypothetical protein